MNGLSALLAGAIFGFGLALSGMTDTNRVLGFLDVTGDWRPALAFVMGSAVLVTLIGFRLVLKRPRPFFAPAFSLPGRRTVDAKLLGGAAVFGLGWGLYGYCPGPALTSLVYGRTDTVLFVVAMALGMALASRTGGRGGAA